VPAHETESVTPEQVTEGDVIQDQLGERWLTVSEITVESTGERRVFAFYGEGPDDRLSFEEAEQVLRRKH
jgi:hypothetical protein